MQVHKNLKSKLIPRARELAVVKVSGGTLQGESRHRPRKFASPAPSPRASPTLHEQAQNTAGDMINTWTKLAHNPVISQDSLGHMHHSPPSPTIELLR